MKQHLNPLRPATAALFAALVLPIAPVFAQDSVAPPPPVVAAPPPIIVAPPPPVTTLPSPPVATPRPAPAPAPTARATPRTPTRATAPARTATRTPVRAPAAAPAAAPSPAPAPVAQAPVETAPPPAAPVEAIAPPVEPVETAPAESQAPTTGAMLPWIIGGLALLVLLAGFFLFRRRRNRDAYEENYYEAAPPRETTSETLREPTFVAPIEAAPVAAAPVIMPVHDPVPEPRPVDQPVSDEATDPLPPPEEIAVAEADSADVEALAASSEPVAGRPWLEFLMRPMRAGTNRDNTIVQFELTVGNTGDVPARDVRISTWVVAAAEGSDMERSLIVPADATVEQVSIEAGEGATVEAKIGLAKDGDESILPVVHADARYTLPDGSEGRTHASFAVGVPAAESGELQPFLTDRSSGLRENVEARLYGEPERV